MPGNINDNSILSIVLALGSEYPEVQVILVSKDINMRIKAAALQINAEDYHNDQAIDDINLLYTGAFELEPDFWETHGSAVESWVDGEKTFYRVKGPLVKDFYPNQFLYIEDSDFEAVVKSVDGETAVLRFLTNYRQKTHNVWGIQAKNRETKLCTKHANGP